MSPPEARVIDITPEKEEAQSLALALPDNARSIQVSDYATKEAANAFFLQCREARKRIAAVFDPHIDRAKAAKMAADATRAGLVAEKTAAEAPIVEAEGIVNREIMRFDAEDKKRRDEELRIATEKQRKENEEAALRAAEEAEAAGDREEADAILEEAAHAPTFVPAPPPPPKLAGSAEVTNWKFKTGDLKRFILAVASGKAPASYLQFNKVVIGSAVRSQKTMFSCPEIQVWPETLRRSTGR